MKGLSVCLSLDTETVNYDHYLRLGGALNFEFSIKKKKKKKKKYIYIYTTGWAIKTIYKQQGVFIKYPGTTI